MNFQVTSRRMIARQACLKTSQMALFRCLGLGRCASGPAGRVNIGRSATRKSEKSSCPLKTRETRATGRVHGTVGNSGKAGNARTVANGGRVWKIYSICSTAFGAKTRGAASCAKYI